MVSRDAIAEPRSLATPRSAPRKPRRKRTRLLRLDIILDGGKVESKSAATALQNKNLRSRTVRRDGAERVTFAAAGPDRGVGKLSAEHVGQLLDRESFAGKMPGQHERDAARFRFQARMKPRLAGDEGVAAESLCIDEKFAGAAASNGNRLHFRLRCGDNLHRLDFEKSRDRSGQFFQRRRFAERAPPPRANRRIVFVGSERSDVLKPQPFRQLLIDAAARRVKRRSVGYMTLQISAAISDSRLRPSGVSLVNRRNGRNGSG